MSSINKNPVIVLSLEAKMALMSVVGGGSSSDDDFDDRSSRRVEPSQMACQRYGDKFPVVGTTPNKEMKSVNKTYMILAIPPTIHDVSSEQFMTMLSMRVNYGNACATEADQNQWIGLLESLTPRQKFSHLVFVNSWLSKSKLSSTNVKKVTVSDGGEVLAMDFVDKDHELSFSMFQAQLFEGFEENVIKTALIPEVVFVLIEHFSLLFFNVGFNVVKFVTAEECATFGTFWSRVIFEYVRCMKKTQQTLNKRNMPISDVCYALRECIRQCVMDDNAGIINTSNDWVAGFERFESSVLRGMNLKTYIAKFNDERFGGVLDKFKAIATKSEDREKQVRGLEKQNEFFTRSMVNMVAWGAISNGEATEEDTDVSRRVRKTARRVQKTVMSVANGAAYGAADGAAYGAADGAAYGAAYGAADGAADGTAEDMNAEP
jgi:hypothetical protein